MGRCKEFDENEVLRKAMELFWEKGYEKTSMNELVEHMEIHRKSLYDTFGDKRSLYLKAIDLYGQNSVARLKAISPKGSTATDTLRKIFDFMIAKNGDSTLGCFFVNAATEMAPCDPEVEDKLKKAFQQAEDYLKEILQQGQDAGEFTRAYSAADLAELLHNAMLGIRVLARISENKEKMERIADFFMTFLIKP